MAFIDTTKNRKVRYFKKIKNSHDIFLFNFKIKLQLKLK